MKRLVSLLTPSALALGLLAGCGGSHPPPAELQNARSAYNRAESDPTAQYNRSGMIETRQSLDDAEREYKDSPKSDEVKTLGYVAERKAEITEADARTAAMAQAELQKEQQTAGRSERRAKVALEQLGLSAKEKPYGTVIALSDANMFATNKAEILPGAEKRLGEIAKAVNTVVAERAPQDTGRKLLLVGYTDDTGRAERNEALSKERAEAVRVFFSQHGLNSANIVTAGRGEANPVADNTTKEGRARNRRVEIVITPSSGATTPR